MEKVISSKIVFECPVFKVEEADVELADGQHAKRWHAILKGAAAVVAIDSKGEMLLTREYRSAAGEVIWRIPGGGVEDGEQPDAAARREMREETGFDCHSLELLLEAKNPSSWVDQRQYFFLARDLFSSPLDTNDEEVIEVVPKSPKELLELIYAGHYQGNMLKALRKAIDIVGSAKS